MRDLDGFLVKRRAMSEKREIRHGLIDGRQGRWVRLVWESPTEPRGWGYRFELPEHKIHVGHLIKNTSTARRRHRGASLAGRLPTQDHLW